MLNVVIGQIPDADRHGMPILVRSDGAGATKQWLNHLRELRDLQGLQVSFSVGFTVTNQVKDAIGLLPCAGGRLQLHNLKPPVEQLVHRRLRARAATLINLVQQPRPHPLGVPGRRRSGRHRLDQVMPLLQHRINPRVDANPKRSTGQPLDPTTGPTATPRRAHQRQPHSGFAPRRQSLALSVCISPSQRAALGNRTPDLRITRTPSRVDSRSDQDFGCMVGISRRPQAR